VLISYIELLFSSVTSRKSGALTALRALRLFRVARLFKLTAYWPSLSMILSTLRKTSVGLLPLTFILFVFMFVFATIGVQLFGGTFTSSTSDDLRSNFDSFLPSARGYGAFMTVFQVLTTENWPPIMYNAMIAKGNAAVLYFVVLVFLGIYLVLNLFIAILLDGFAGVSQRLLPDTWRTEHMYGELVSQSSEERQAWSPGACGSWNEKISRLARVVIYKKGFEATILVMFVFSIATGCCARGGIDHCFAACRIEAMLRHCRQLTSGTALILSHRIG
jgi:hypothetical protein